MAEFVFRAIGAVLEALLDALIAHTGKRVLSLWRLNRICSSKFWLDLLFGRLLQSC